MGSCNCSIFCCALLCAHLDGEERTGCFAILSFWCLVIVVWLFLTVPWVCLQFVFGLLPDNTHLLFFIELYCLNVKLSFLVVALYLALYAQY